MCKKLTALLLTFMILFNMVGIIAMAEETATPDFVIAAGEVEVEVGATEVEVPISIVKMYEDKLIGGLTVEVNYDAEKFTFNEADWTKGSMIKVPADVILNVTTPGLIRIMFTSATDPISADMVATDNLFGTVKLGIKDPTAPFVSAITLTTNDDLYDDAANTLIPEADMGASLKAGKVTVKSKTTGVTVKQIYVKDVKHYYTVGDEFVKPTVMASYSNSYSSRDVTSNATFTGYDMSKVGQQTVTVTYEDKTTDFTIFVRDAATPVVVSISVTDAKTEYLLGDKFVMPTVVGLYSDGSTRVLNGGVSFTGFYMDRAGTQTIIAKFEDITTTYTITVKEVSASPLESIEVVDPKTEYFAGEKFVAPTVIGLFEDGSAHVLTGGMYYSGTNTTTPGTRTVTVSFQGRTASYTINVREVVVPGGDFAVEVDNVTPEKGATKIDVPIRITKMFTDRNVNFFSVDVTYDTDLLSWKVTNYMKGPCFKGAPSDIVVMELRGKGTISVIFSSESCPITPEDVALGNVFITLKFTVKDTNKDFTTDIGLKGSGTRVGTSVGDYPKEDFNDDVKGNSLTYKKTFPFEAKVSDVVANSGATEIKVPIKITRTFSDKDVDKLAVAVSYDTDKLSWAQDGGYQAGTMIADPDADITVSEPYEKGQIVISYANKDNPITSDAVTADDTFITLTFTVNHPSISFNTPVELYYLSPTSSVPADALFPVSEWKDAFKAGSVTFDLPPTILYGDASGDGTINNDDLGQYKNYLQFDEGILDITAADLNNDGRINITDIVILRNYIELELPIAR